MAHHDTKNCRDYSHFGSRVQNLYECQTVGHDAFGLLFCFDSWFGNSDLLYCASCFGCEHCFGCVGLRKCRYCVLNRQYSEGEYQQLVRRVIAAMRARGEWGEFFPMRISAFPYNNSFAARYFPLTPADVAAQGLVWYEPDEVDGSEAAAADRLPDGLPAGDHPITVLSAASGRPFRITAAEIKRYRERRAPLPRIGYLERMEGRWSRLGGIRLLERSSAGSGRPLVTSLGPDLAPVIWDRAEWEQEVW